MRRSLSILLAVIFGLGPLTFVLPQNDNASLPACCRRHGAHHCTMPAPSSSASEFERSSVFTAPSHCPLYPAHQSANLTSFAAIVRWPVGMAANVQPAPAAAAHFFGIADFNLCTFTLRGPPTLLSS
jgi:hypothetical protein